MSKVPYRKKRKVEKAKKKFDKKLKKDKKAEQFYVKETDKEALILDKFTSEQDELKDEIRLDLLEREKRKDELKAFSVQKVDELERKRVEQDVAIDIATERRLRPRTEEEQALEQEQVVESRDDEE